MKKKLITKIACILAVSSLLTGCNDKIPNEISELQSKVSDLESAIQEKDSNTSKDTAVKSGYSKELAQFVFQGSKKEFQCNPRMPVNIMTCTSESETQSGDEKIYKYQAELKTLADPPYDVWSSEITITKDAMIESNPLSSIAKDKIQLKLPLEKGNTWSQAIDYNNKKYQMKHEIIEVVENQNGKNLCVKSTIDNFGTDGFTYVEAAIYQQNIGIVASDRDDGIGRGYYTFSLIYTEPSDKNQSLDTYYYSSGIDLNKAFEE